MALARETQPRPQNTEFIDLDSVTQLKPARKVSDQFLGEVPKKGQGGSSALPPDAAQFLIQAIAGQNGNAQEPAEPAGSQAQAPQVAQPAVPVTEPTVQPPPQPAPQGSRVQARIDKLYGKMRSAEERAAESDARYAEVLRRLDALQAPRAASAPAAPPSAQFDPFFTPVPTQEASQAGSFVSRQELLEVVNRQTQKLVELQALQQAQSVSHGEAQRDFPEVFSTPDLKEAADRILSSDPAFRSDPMGPYKAAALARGMYLGSPAGGGGQGSAMAQKQLLSGLGPTVPEGSGNPQDRVTRYQQAMARARSSGSVEDAAAAWKIMMGID